MYRKSLKVSDMINLNSGDDGGAQICVAHQFLAQGPQVCQKRGGGVR